MGTSARPRILLFGASGQLGRELHATLPALGAVRTVARSEADLASPEELRDIVRMEAPRVIVNAAAYTAVDRAESEPERAEAVNAVAPTVLAEEAERLGAILVHYSTDYVFDGEKLGPYVETDAPNPLSVYGATKLRGEQGVARSCRRHLILRTSWVYAAHGANFLRTILRLAAERESLRIVADQRGVPTSANRIAIVTAAILTAASHEERGRWGTYHLAPAGETTWHEYASFIVEQARSLGASLRATPQCIFPIATTEYLTAAKRPANSRLDTGKLRSAFRVDLPEWRPDVLEVLRLLTPTQTQ